MYTLDSLREKFPSANISNDVRKNSKALSHEGVPYNKIIGDDDFILNDIVRKPNAKPATDAFLRAGPRAITHFDPSQVKAAIVTCGGLCPGLNNVVREIVHALYYLYGVDQVLGIRLVIPSCSNISLINMLIYDSFFLSSFIEAVITVSQIPAMNPSHSH